MTRRWRGRVERWRGLVEVERGEEGWVGADWHPVGDPGPGPAAS